MSLIFINTLISGADDIDMRIHIRNEFFANELLHMLKVRSTAALLSCCSSVFCVP